MGDKYGMCLSRTEGTIGCGNWREIEMIMANDEAVRKDWNLKDGEKLARV